jgi:hypothetical protein
MESALRQSDTSLDERQRTQLHAASHKALRAVMLAVLAAMIATNVVYEDLAISVIIAGIGFVAMISHWYYQRQLGIDREIELAGARAEATESFFSVQNLLQFGLFFALTLSSNVQTATVTTEDVLIALAGAAIATIVLWLVRRSHARRLLEKELSGEESMSYRRGEEIGRRIARLIRRR